MRRLTQKFAKHLPIWICLICLLIVCWGPITEVIASNIGKPGGAGASFYQTILDEAVALTQRPSFNFTGAGVTAADDAGNNRTNVTIPGGGNVTTSATLTAGLPVIGNGGVDADIGTRSGNTTEYMNGDGGGYTSGNCAEFDASGNITDSGAGCGGGAGALSVASMVRATAQTIAAGAADQIEFDNIAFQSGTSITADVGNNQFDINEDGIYLIRCSWGSTDLADGLVMRSMIYVDGAEVRRWESMSSGATGDPSAGSEDMISLLTGQTVEFYVFQENVGTMDTDTSVVSRPTMYVARIADLPPPPPGEMQLITDTFTSDGTWTAPADVSVATVEAWGAGGGGGAGGAGGGGGYSRSPALAVTPSGGHAVVVGTSATSTDGGDSSFAATDVVAKGGLAGNNGGTGGQASAGTGGIKFDGGDGGQGGGTQSGGGGAGDAAAGVLTVGGLTNGGTATNGGTGVAGRMFASGGGNLSGTLRIGAQGHLRVTYETAAPALFPYVVGRSWNRDASGTSHAITLPSGITAGNLLLITVAIRQVSGSTPVTLSIGSGGWTKLGQASNLGDVTVAVFYKTAVGGDTATVSSTVSASTAHIAYEIAHGGVPEWSTAEGFGGGDPPSHTSSAGAVQHLWLAGAYFRLTSSSGTVVDSTAPPTNYRSFICLGGETWGCSSDRQLTAATENPGAISGTTEAYLAYTISIPYS